MRSSSDVSTETRRGPAGFALVRAMRPHQWLKNLLVLMPLFAAHLYGDEAAVVRALVAFVAFCIAASSVYILNDIVDVQADRNHPRKRLRPFASGELTARTGWIAWPLLMAAALALSWFALPPRFGAFLVVYCLCSLAYSMQLKQFPMLDVVTLASLYTVRIAAGAAAVRAPLSFWLLAFSVFFFFSLACVKRFSELREARGNGEPMALRGRGYDDRDLEMVAMLGTSCGCIAALVLALYVQDPRTAQLYAHPEIIWLACPLLLYWVARTWLLAHRGDIHEDPIVFALNDRASWVVLVLAAVVFLLARLSPLAA